MQFGGDADDSDAEEISLGSKDTGEGWSEQSFATSSVAEDSEVEDTPPKSIKAASRPAGILKAPTTLSPTENLAKMVKESMTFKSPPKSKNKASNKVTSGGVYFPHISYVWKDSVRNRMVTLEIHLPSATSRDDIELRLLESSDGAHSLSVKYKFSEMFLCEEIFDENCELKKKNMTINSVNRLASRADHLLSLRSSSSKGKDTNGIAVAQEFPLPFRVENFFNLPIGTAAYNGTGTEFRAYPIACEKDDGTEEKETEMVILFVTLVDEDQLINQVQKNTPSKITKAKQYKRK